MTAGRAPKQIKSLRESICMPNRRSRRVLSFFVDAIFPSNISQTPEIATLIEVNKDNPNREISFREAVCYGKKAAHIFRQKTGKETVLLFSEDQQAGMIERYPQYLDVDAYINRSAFRLRNGASIAEIEGIFRWTLDDELLDALTSHEAIRMLAE